MRFGIEPAFPFADRTVLAIAKALPAARKYDTDEEKPFLRETFAFVDLPREIRMRAKLCSKENLHETKANFFRLADLLLPDQYVATHPYRRFLEHTYLIMCFDIFARMFIDRRGVRVDTLVNTLFDAPLGRRLQKYVGPVGYRALFGTRVERA